MAVCVHLYRGLILNMRGIEGLQVDTLLRKEVGSIL